MARVKRGFKARRRRNKVLKFAKGYHFDRRTKYRHAVQTVERALHYAFINRRKFNQKQTWDCCGLVLSLIYTEVTLLLVEPSMY